MHDSILITGKGIYAPRPISSSRTRDTSGAVIIHIINVNMEKKLVRNFSLKAISSFLI
jgi:hypothetical protein